MADTDGSRVGIWLNKRALVSVELAFDHVLAPEGSGWRITVGASGVIEVHLRDGGPRRIDVAAGDSIVSTGDDMYISTRRARGGK